MIDRFRVAIVTHWFQSCPNANCDRARCPVHDIATAISIDAGFPAALQSSHLFCTGSLPGSALFNGWIASLYQGLLASLAE